MKNMKKKIIAFILLIAVAAMSGCGKEEKKNPKLADNPKMFYEEWDKAALDNIDVKKVKEGLATNYPEELDLEKGSRLFKAEDFTGPILCYTDKDSDYQFNGIYIPNQKTDAYLFSPELKDGLEIGKYTYSAERIPDEYLSDDKLKQLQKKKQPIVFAFVECTGYTESAVYVSPSGSTDEVYWLSWRVAFYSYPDMTLLGWETAQRPYAKPESMSYDRTHPDGNKRRVYIYDDNGSRIDVMDVTMKLIYGDK